jgi:hypothetical protein
MPVISDTFGNHFLGTYLVPEGTISNQLADLMDAAVGAGNNAQSGVGTETMIAWRPNIGDETFTGTITTVVSGTTAAEEARFAQFLGDSTTTPGRFGYFRTGATGGTDLIDFDVTPDPSEGSLDGARNWATASNKSLGIFTYDDATNYHFSYAGILNNAPGYIYPTNSVIITLGSVGGTPYGRAIRPQSSSGNTVIEYTIDNNSNYTPVCSNGATIPTVTELYFRDDNAGSGYPATGFADNLLFARGAFVVGDPYFVEFVDGTDTITGDPILGSDFRFYICCGQIGSDYILMRVGE